MKNLMIAKKDLQILNHILTKYPYQFYAYGSRVKGLAREFSDLDLCYFDNISRNEILDLNDDFVESDLSFIVQLVSWNDMRPAFQEIIRKDLVKI